MRNGVRWIALATGALSLFACRHDAGTAPAQPAEIPGLQGATEAYLAYQHSDCETVYRLTRPELIEAMQATELRHSLHLIRGYCQEIDGDQPEARATYRRVIADAPSSFAAADAGERLAILDRLADDPEFAGRVERAAREGVKPVEARERKVQHDALYPPLARAAQIEGFAVVDFAIARNGRTVDPIVVDSNPPFLFEGSALRAVRSWEYKSKRRADPDARHVIRIVFQPLYDVAPITEETSSATPEANPEANPEATPAATVTPAIEANR